MTSDRSSTQVTPLADEHARRRERRVAASSIAALAARALSVAVSIVSIPLVIDYLGAERFGLWVTATAVISMLTFTDLGLGNGLLNIVSESQGREDKVLARQAVSTTLGVLALAALALLVLGMAAALVVPWVSVFNTTRELTDRELVPGLGLYIALFAIGLPLSVAERTRLGLQEAYVNSAWGVMGTLGTLAGTLLAVMLKAPLPTLILLSAGPPLLAAGFNFCHLFFVQHRELCPSPAFVAPALAGRLLRLGLMFVALQVAVSVAFQSDVVVAAAVLGPEAAAQYSVASRVFLFAPTLIGIVLATFWPAYGEAISRGDIQWVTRWLRRSVVGALAVAVVSSAALVAASPWIFDRLTTGKLTIPIGLILGLAVWAIVSSAFNAIGMLLNAASVVGFQAVVALSMGATSICLSIVLANMIGVAGVIWGTVIAYVLVTGIPVLLFMPRFLDTLRAGGGRSSASDAGA